MHLSFLAYEGVYADRGSVKFDTSGEKIVTAMCGDSPNSTINAYDFEEGIMCHSLHMHPQPE